jgi:hypothetical protein
MRAMRTALILLFYVAAFAQGQKTTVLHQV